MKNCRLFPIVLVAGMFVCAAASSFGEAILFQDDFENGAVGSSPVAETGSWSFLSTGGVVQDANPPGAAGGSKYMSVSRSGWSQANSDFASQPVGTQLTLGVDVWGDPTASANPLIYATDHDGGNDAFYLSFAQDGKVKSNAGNEFDWLPNAWNHVEINYVVGASTWGVHLQRYVVRLWPANAGHLQRHRHSTWPCRRQLKRGVLRQREGDNAHP